MYYWGKFRNNDTTIDPLGQEYKVVIFTNYDGATSPYGFTIDGEPILGTELVMTTSPFIVSYQNEDNNIYKPYKCSTATLSFLQSTLNLDLVSNKYNNILVALLKRNNDVILSGNTYINRNTNEVLIRKRTYGLYYGFLPSEIDAYCYNVEWIGYVTPNTYNQTYTLVEQEFQLECQDAFSTLKYESLPFNDLIEIRDLITVLRFIIGGLGTYRNVYVQNNLILPDDGTTSLSKIVQQYRNFIDNEPVDKMQLIESIGTFLNVSFIPFRDSVYIVQYEGVVNNDNYFYHYTFNRNNNLFFNYRTDNPTWGDFVIENKENNLTLNKDCYASNDTNISMQTVYNNFSVGCDENEIQLVPKLTDDKYYTGLQRCIESEDIVNNNETIIKWKGGIITNIQQVDGMGFKNYIYNQSFLYDDEPQYSDIPVSPTLQPSIFKMNPNDGDNSSNYYCGCVLIKNASVTASHIDVPNFEYRFNYDNVIVFWNKNWFDNFDTVSQSTMNDIWDNNKQKVLEYQSPRFLLHEGKSLCFKGEWEFYRETGFIYDFNLPSFKVDKTKLFIKARVALKIEDGVYTRTYYLRKSNDDYVFSLSEITDDNPQIVDLPLDDYSYDANKPFGQPFKFKGEDDGFVVDLVDSAGNFFVNPMDDVTYSNLIASFKVEIMNPMGFAYEDASNDLFLFSRSARVKNLDFKIKDRKQVETWRAGDIKTDFKTEQNRFLETFEIENTLSTNEYVGKANYNYCVRVYNQHYHQLNNLNNISTGLVARPEILKLADIYNQYKDKTIGLNTTVWENLNITPNSRIKWDNKYFIVDNQQIDYEANHNTITLIEKKLSSELPELDMKMYCENDNGETIYINPLYGETDEITLQTTNTYYKDGSAVMGSTINDVNSLITFSTKFTDGIEAFVSIPNRINYISVYISNDIETYGELIINQ